MFNNELTGFITRKDNIFVGSDDELISRHVSTLVDFYSYYLQQREYVIKYM